MTRAKTIGFVRALLAGAGATHNDKGQFVVSDGGRVARLDGALVAGLVSAGVLSGDREQCWATPLARQWVRRQLLGADGFGGQHRLEASEGDGRVVNLNESPLARLAARGPDGAAYLLPHQVEAGERLRRLVDRAHLQPRMTMTYSHELRTGGKGSAGDIGDMASDARRALDEIMRVLPPDCAGVVMDVCGLMKGLQLVESERGWPRRSAKLVLRIGLEQLAGHFGLAPAAVGPARGRERVWGVRPTQVG